MEIYLETKRIEIHKLWKASSIKMATSIDAASYLFIWKRCCQGYCSVVFSVLASSIQLNLNKTFFMLERFANSNNEEEEKEIFKLIVGRTINDSGKAEY